MITLEDCIAMSGLPRDTILAIAEHEHVPEIVAAGLASHLVACEEGYRRIGAIIAEDVVVASHRGDLCHAGELKNVLRNFVRVYPEAMASVRVRNCLSETQHSLQD